MKNIEYINNFLNDLLHIKNYSKETIDNYKRDLIQLNNSLEQKSLTSLNRTDVSIWIKKLHAQGNSTKTIQRKISSIRSFFNFLLNNRKSFKMQRTPGPQQ